MKLYFKTDSQCLKCKIQQPNLHNHQTRGSHMEISFPLLDTLYIRPKVPEPPKTTTRPRKHTSKKFVNVNRQALIRQNNAPAMQ